MPIERGAERVTNLTRLRDQYEAALADVRGRLPTASAMEARTLIEQDAQLLLRIEQCDIEIGFIQDPDGLIRDYRRQFDEALGERNAAATDAQRQAFQRRADFCRTVTDDVLAEQTKLHALPDGALHQIETDLNAAATMAKSTVAAINNAIGALNTALDGLIILARVAARVAV